MSDEAPDRLQARLAAARNVPGPRQGAPMASGPGGTLPLPVEVPAGAAETAVSGAARPGLPAPVRQMGRADRESGAHRVDVHRLPGAVPDRRRDPGMEDPGGRARLRVLAADRAGRGGPGPGKVEDGPDRGGTGPAELA